MRHLLLLAAALLGLAACGDTDPAVAAAKDVHVEVVLNDRHIPKVDDARILVLPTGERVLVLTGGEGLATCCLLPAKGVAAAQATAQTPVEATDGGGHGQ